MLSQHLAKKLPLRLLTLSVTLVLPGLSQGTRVHLLAISPHPARPTMTHLLHSGQINLTILLISTGLQSSHRGLAKMTRPRPRCLLRARAGLPDGLPHPGGHLLRRLGPLWL